MSKVRTHDTAPELAVRKLLHRSGFRYRLHVNRLSGKPDIVLARFKTAIFVHGCFWHSHQDCKYFKVPATNRQFWMEKLAGNSARDKRNQSALLAEGWRVLVVWECAVRTLADQSKLEQQLLTWLSGHTPFGQLPTSVDSPSTLGIASE